MRRWSAPPTWGSTPRHGPGSTTSRATSAGATRRGHPRGRDRRGRGVTMRRLRRRRRRHHTDGFPGLRNHPRRHFATPVVGRTIDQLAVMSIYGPTGATAYFGMTGIGRPQPGRDGRRLGGGRGHRLGGRPDRQDRRRPGGRYRWRAGEVPGGGRRLRFRRVHRLPERATWRLRSSSTVREVSTSTSTTSAGRSSMRCWAAWRRRRGWCCAASSRATSPVSTLDRRTT